MYTYVLSNRNHHKKKPRTAFLDQSIHEKTAPLRLVGG